MCVYQRCSHDAIVMKARTRRRAFTKGAIIYYYYSLSLLITWFVHLLEQPNSCKKVGYNSERNGCVLVQKTT